MEYDQYDTPASRWIAIHELGNVVAGIRLTPTTARCGIYSYMIKDAQDGLLNSLPQDLLFDAAPVHPNIWEVTRVFRQSFGPATGAPPGTRVHGGCDDPLGPRIGCASADRHHAGELAALVRALRPDC